MEAKDLMIGDWVHVEAHRGFNAQNVKVETIPDNDGDNEYGHHYGHIGTWLDGGDNDFRDVEAKHLQPIPLTPEILEKNGWEERPTGYVFYTDGKRYDNSLWYIFGSNTFVVNTTEFQIKYVHELQHALRLCGIEKEIIL